MRAFLQHLVDALSTGSTYVLLGLGIGIVFSVMGLINFAYGTLIVWAGYTLAGLSSSWGFPYPLALLGMVAVTVGLSLMMGRVAFRPFLSAPPSTLLLTSFGVALALQAIAIAFFGDESRVVPIPDWLGTSLRIGSIRVSALQLVSIGAAVVVLFALELVLHRTALGLHIRAAAENPTVARLLGVRTPQVITAVFALSGVVSGIVAFLWLAKIGTVGPRADLTPTLKAFIVVVLGGIGTVRGAVVGGLVLGLFESLLAAYVPESLSSYQGALTFTLVIAVLLFRPQGIAGKTVEVSK